MSETGSAVALKRVRKLPKKAFASPKWRRVARLAKVGPPNHWARWDIMLLRAKKKRRRVINFISWCIYIRCFFNQFVWLFLSLWLRLLVRGASPPSSARSASFRSTLRPQGRNMADGAATIRAMGEIAKCALRLGKSPRKYKRPMGAQITHILGNGYLLHRKRIPLGGASMKSGANTMYRCVAVTIEHGQVLRP